jgi:hypothetical protein
MYNVEDLKSFRLSTGGLVYKLLNLLHIQQPGRYSFKRRHIALITLCWLPLLLLTAIEGNLFNTSIDSPFIYDLSPYVRYLIVLPLLINADVIIDRLIISVLQSVSTSGILGDDNKDKYNKAVEKLSQRKDSYIADIVILVISYSVVLLFLNNLEELSAITTFTNWIIADGDAGARLTYAGWWYVLVSSPVLQIILYRWLWRFYLWVEFLFRISRIKLKLQPTHPDEAGGLGILKNGESAFIMIALAFGALLSEALAEDIIYTDMTLMQSLTDIITFIITTIILMTLPMFFFTRQLAMSRRWGLVVYGDLGHRLSNAFDNKWGDTSDESNGDELLKTADSSVVCDYADIYKVVEDMRFIPVRLKGYFLQLTVLIIPFIPLILTEYSLTDILKRVFDTMI